MRAPTLALLLVIGPPAGAPEVPPDPPRPPQRLTDRPGGEGYVT